MKRLVTSNRLYEISVPIITWIIITFPIWLSPFHPAICAYLIFMYLIYFFYKTLKTVYYASLSYRLLEKASKVNWYKKLQKNNSWQQIFHVVIIVNYKESYEKIKKTIEAIKSQNYQTKKIMIVLAMEEREGQEAKLRSKKLTTKYQQHFYDIQTTYHKLLDGEVVGKASNEAYAGRFIEKYLDNQKIQHKNVIITVCDADSILSHNYFAYLALSYINNPQREYHFYWAPVLLYANFWKLSLPIRVQSILSSVVRLSFLSWKDDLMPISTYSLSFWLLKEIDYWDSDIVPEDWHIWLQAFFKYGEKIKTIPIYLPVSRDAVHTDNYLTAYKTRYQQERRWAWGVTDLPYAYSRLFDTPHISLLVKIKRILFITETHIMWPTSFFLLTIAASIPPIINPVFKRTVLGFLLPKLSSFILTFTSGFLLLILYFDFKLRKKLKIKTEYKKLPLLFIQWYLLPVISFIFSSLPALDAHTKMLLGKKLTYKVTKKM